MRIIFRIVMVMILVLLVSSYALMIGYIIELKNISNQKLTQYEQSLQMRKEELMRINDQLLSTNQNLQTQLKQVSSQTTNTAAASGSTTSTTTTTLQPAAPASNPVRTVIRRPVRRRVVTRAS